MKHTVSAVPRVLAMLAGLAAAAGHAAASDPATRLSRPGSPPDTPPDEACVDLVAGQPAPMAPAVTVGEVCLETRESALLVYFRAGDGWSLAETQLAVAASLDGIPRAEVGIPIIGRFPHRTAHTPAVPEFRYSLPLEELAVSDGHEVVVAAHASAVNTAGVEEGGWGRGERFTAQGNPAMYFRYTIGEADRPQR